MLQSVNIAAVPQQALEVASPQLTIFGTEGIGSSSTGEDARSGNRSLSPVLGACAPLTCLFPETPEQ